MHRFSYVFLLVFPLLFSSCIGRLFGDDDDDIPRAEEVNNQLQGEWEVTSWEVNGIELIPDGVRSWPLDFDREEFDTGEVEWDVDFVRNDFQDIREDLSYQISADGDELTMGNNTFELDLDGDDMELEGDVRDGNDLQEWRIEAERD